MKQPHKVIPACFLLVLYGALTLFPIYWSITTSFKSREQIFVRKPEWFPGSFTLANYAEMFSRGSVSIYFFNSIVVAALTVALTLVIASMAGFGLTRYRFRGRRFITYSILTVRIVPSLVYLIPFYLIFSHFKLTDKIHTLVFCYSAISLPLAVWLFIGFFEEIPSTIYEAALIDGASEYGLFFKVAFPMVLSGVVVVTLLTFLAAWNEFAIALILTNKDSVRTLPMGINTMIMNQKEKPYGFLTAAGTVAMLPALVLAVTTQKYLIRGLMAGSVKG
ncbi:MAG: carbohydrate ABC transporter permease [Treponema sp.]|jgi:ABC-type glycerol-3-phosphate transport system permease component|nr:carbohydrate ABC transporter permease [Treponema sp.]